MGIIVSTRHTGHAHAWAWPIDRIANTWQSRARRRVQTYADAPEHVRSLAYENQARRESIDRMVIRARSGAGY